MGTEKIKISCNESGPTSGVENVRFNHEIDPVDEKINYQVSNSFFGLEYRMARFSLIFLCSEADLKFTRENVRLKNY